MLKSIVIGSAACVVAFAAGMSINQLEAFQSDTDTADSSWEIYHSAFGQQSFYVVKHNRVTGETLILFRPPGEDADKEGWLVLPTDTIP